MKRAFPFYILLAAVMLGAPAATRAQHQRVVLVEEFTSLTCKPCTTATVILNDLVKNKKGRVLTIRYHANIPLPGDPFYAANKAHNDARKDYYAVSGLPFGVADGSTNMTVTQEGDVLDKVDARLVMQAPIKLDVKQTRNGDRFDVEVKVTAGPEGLGAGDNKLRVAVVEALVIDTRYLGDPRYNGESEFHDVMRTMLPDPSGSDLTINPEEVKTFNFSYSIGSEWQADQMYVIAFVQNDNGREIIQAGNSPVPVAGIREVPTVAGYDLEGAYPNPATESAEFGYTLAAAQDVRMDLYDAAGQLVRSQDEGRRERGTHRCAIDLADLPAGVYTYTVRAGVYRASRMVIVR